VAVKRVVDVFSSFENAERILRELQLLRALDCASIVKLIHVEAPR
jgi:hypothetical protein